MLLYVKIIYYHYICVSRFNTYRGMFKILLYLNIFFAPFEEPEFLFSTYFIDFISFYFSFGFTHNKDNLTS